MNEAGPTHRVWVIDFGERVAIVWMQDGRPVNVQVGEGHPLAHYIASVREKGPDLDSIDFVTPDALMRSARSGQSCADLMRAAGLNPQLMRRSSEAAE